MCTHDPSRTAAGIPLEAHVEELRRRCETVAGLQGGSTHYLEEIGIFDDYVRELDLLLENPPSELSGPPDEEGNEHQVWFQQKTGTYLKATWPNFFGLLVVYRQGEESKASPIAYLERWHLHNEIFGDEVRFLGALQTEQGLRLLISQPAIEGKPATEADICRFFRESGWEPFSIGENQAFFDRSRQVVVSDTHRGNLVLMDDGLLAPIDLRVQPLTGALLDIVIKLATSGT